jgi:hypothetical protein
VTCLILTVVMWELIYILNEEKCTTECYNTISLLTSIPSMLTTVLPDWWRLPKKCSLHSWPTSSVTQYQSQISDNTFTQITQRSQIIFNFPNSEHHSTLRTNYTVPITHCSIHNALNVRALSPSQTKQISTSQKFTYIITYNKHHYT